MTDFKEFIGLIEDKGLSVSINLDRPYYVQPEDRIAYRAHRILLILRFLNTTHGLSKQVIACMDFLLRNPGFQKAFVFQYFKEQKSAIKKFSRLDSIEEIGFDRNVVQYKSVPWDLRFNDMFLYLMTRKLVETIGSSDNMRLILNEAGLAYSEKLETVFAEESNFLDLFGKTLSEKKSIEIITEVIPRTYWKQNEESFYQ